MKKIFNIFIIFSVLSVFSSTFLSFAQAADIRNENNINITKSEKSLKDPYLFGNSITVEAPVTNDLVAAGGDVFIDSSISGNILTAGGALRIRGNSIGSVRAAGGNIVIEGSVGRDLVVAGGSVLMTKSATVAGDLIIAGGDLTVQGDVRGKTIINGGQARIDGRLDKQVQGNVGSLTIGRSAIIGGDLIYSSTQKARIENGAVIKGEQKFTKIEELEKTAQGAASFFKAVSFYKLIADILLSILLIFFFNKFLQEHVRQVTTSTFNNFVLGFVFLILMPLISVFLFILLLPGVASLLFYFLVLILAVYLAKIFTGWIIIRWWYKRNGKDYVLDWKSGIAGPIALFILGIIPILGWLFIAILYLINIGAFLKELTAVAQAQKNSIKNRK